ncbi:MAG: glycosyltransferase [Anaerolineae bacterium]|nr:glycosyltransferase [Anaerolineae bacterium]
MTAINKSRRVLLICNDTIGHNMAGPGIRYWEFARVLSNYFTVTLAIPPSVAQKTVPTAAFTVKLCQTDTELYALTEESDVVVTVGAVLSAHPILLKLKKPLLLDIYIPSLMETLHVYSLAGLAHKSLFYNERERNAHNTQLRIADFMICASEKQRDYWLGMLTALGRVNPHSHQDDKTLRGLIDVVPFGLPKEKAVHSRPVLKGVYKNIQKDDDVLIWTGGIWEWLDAPTLIKAMPLVVQKQPQVKLFFMGIKRPNRSETKMFAVDEAIALSQTLGLYDTHIFFNEWVPYEERQNYLLEANLGVSLHLNHVENRFSFRTRFLDHLWTGLPLLATEGDVMSAELVRLNLGRTVKPGDVSGVAEAILEMLTDKTTRQDYLAQLENVVAQYQWETVTQPLVEFCAKPHFAPDKAYLQTIPVFEVGATPYWKLPQKAWRALKNNGLPGLWWQIKRYLAWKQHKWDVD